MKRLLLFLCLLTGCYRHVNLPEKKPEAQQKLQKASVPLILLKLYNFERNSRSTQSLELDNDLNRYAQNHAEYMAKHNTLVHSNIHDLLEDYNACAENIACGQATPEEVVKSWMNSYGHRSNILSSTYKHVGFGYFSIEGGIYWCAVFGD